MPNHRKDPSLFTKAPLIPYLSSQEQEFPLLISVQNLPHTWDTDLAGVPKSIVEQIQKQSVKSFLNLRAFLTIIIKGELMTVRGVLMEAQAHRKSSITCHVPPPGPKPELRAGQHSAFQAVPLSTHILTADRRQLHMYLREFSRHHSCLSKHKENTSPLICNSLMCGLFLFQLLLAAGFQPQSCLSPRTGFSHFNKVHPGQRKDGRGKDGCLLPLFARLCHCAQSIHVCWHRQNPQAVEQGQSHLPTWGV